MVIKMLRAFKVEINPTEAQRIKIHQTIGTCRFIYNMYIAHNKERHEKGLNFVSAMTFSKWLNNEFIPSHPEFMWIKESSSKAIKQSMFNAERAFKDFFNKKKGFPKFKKKGKSNTGMYLPKNNLTDWTVERHRVKVPTLCFVRLKEFGYIPLDSNVMSGVVTMRAGKYFVSVLCEVEELQHPIAYNTGEAIGIDLGIKELAMVSTEQVFKNINKTKRVKKLTQRLKREQRRLSCKFKRRRNIKMKGTYNLKCYKRNGTLRWEGPINNVVTTEGRHAILDAAFSGGTPLLSYIGLISSKGFKSEPKKSDTLSHHPTWIEAGLDSNYPHILKGERVKVEWCPAENENKKILEVDIPIGRKGGLIIGCFIVTGTGPTEKIEDTTGILLSAGLFTGGVKKVKRWDRLRVSYNISL